MSRVGKPLLLGSLKKIKRCCENQKKCPIPRWGQMPQDSVVERTSDSGW